MNQKHSRAHKFFKESSNAKIEPEIERVEITGKIYNKYKSRYEIEISIYYKNKTKIKKSIHIEKIIEQYFTLLTHKDKLDIYKLYFKSNYIDQHAYFIEKIKNLTPASKLEEIKRTCAKSIKADVVAIRINEGEYNSHKKYICFVTIVHKNKKTTEKSMELEDLLDLYFDFLSPEDKKYINEVKTEYIKDINEFKINKDYIYYGRDGTCHYEVTITYNDESHEIKIMNLEEMVKIYYKWITSWNDDLPDITKCLSKINLKNDNLVTNLTLSEEETSSSEESIIMQSNTEPQDDCTCSIS